jgi:hypothetical protein
MKHTLDQIRALANERGEIDGAANLRPLLEEAKAHGLLESIPGRLSMQPPGAPGESIKLFGHPIPVMGALYEVYKLTDKARAALKDEE